MDFMPAEPAMMLPPMAPTMDPRIYLATLAILPDLRLLPLLPLLALAAALTAYHFPSLPPGMLFPEHHWMDYPDALKEEIQRILLPQPTPAVPVPQVAQPAPVIAQAAALLPTALSQSPPPATLLPSTAPMDVQTPQAPSTSAPALDRHGQPIPKPGHYEHSVKHKRHLQEEADYHKYHKMCTTDEPRTQ
uniref:Uncharacterized protein n=1 Tax=Romanomermis culicivorax TaxID=13658 RepID=A0A915IKE2_ROMCU